MDGPRGQRNLSKKCNHHNGKQIERSTTLHLFPRTKGIISCMQTILAEPVGYVLMSKDLSVLFELFPARHYSQTGQPKNNRKKILTQILSKGFFYIKNECHTTNFCKKCKYGLHINTNLE